MKEMELANFLIKNFDTMIQSKSLEGTNITKYRGQVCEVIRKIYGKVPPYYENYKNFESKIFQSRNSVESFKEERSRNPSMNNSNAKVEPKSKDKDFHTPKKPMPDPFQTHFLPNAKTNSAQSNFKMNFRNKENGSREKSSGSKLQFSNLNKSNGSLKSNIKIHFPKEPKLTNRTNFHESQYMNNSKVREYGLNNSNNFSAEQSLKNSLISEKSSLSQKKLLLQQEIK